MSVDSSHGSQNPTVARSRVFVNGLVGGGGLI